MKIEKTMKVSGMHCRSCEMRLAEVVAEIRGIEGVKVDRGKGTVTINCNDECTARNARRAIEKEGYEVV